MDVKVKLVNEKIVQVFTMKDELFCSFVLPPERGKLTYDWMATRIEHLFYDDIKSADRIDVISYIIKHCKREGFVPRLFFEDEDVRQNIGALIREVRLKRGLVAKDVAMLVGIAAPNYSHIENGQTSPTYKTLLRIADVLDMSVKEALEFFDSIPAIRNKLQTLNDVGLDYIKLGLQTPILNKVIFSNFSRAAKKKKSTY